MVDKATCVTVGVVKGCGRSGVEMRGNVMRCNIKLLPRLTLFIFHTKY